MTEIERNSTDILRDFGIFDGSFRQSAELLAQSAIQVSGTVSAAAAAAEQQRQASALRQQQQALLGSLLARQRQQQEQLAASQHAAQQQASKRLQPEPPQGWAPLRRGVCRQHGLALADISALLSPAHPANALQVRNTTPAPMMEVGLESLERRSQSRSQMGSVD